VILALVLVACSASSSPSGFASGSVPALRPVTLLLGFRPDVQFAPFYLAQQAGFYADVGLEVTIEHAADVIRPVADGQAELGVADATDVMISRTAGIPIRYVSTLYERFPVALIGPAGSVPDSPAGLAGLRIGTPGTYGSSWHSLLALLDSAGLGADDVIVRAYPQYNQVEGLLNGDVDLITGFRNNEPLQLEARGMSVDLLSVDDVGGLPGPGLIVGDEVLAANPDMVAAFAAATIRAQQAIRQDPQVGLAAALEAVPAIAEDEATALAVLTATVSLWSADGPPTGEINATLWERGYQTMKRLGFIDGSVPLEEMISAVIKAPG
jgi:NitT/TauT family transport system substrate-binding protein